MKKDRTEYQPITIVKLHCQEYTNIRTNIDTQINLEINLDYLPDHRNSLIIHSYHDYVSMTQKKEMSARNNNYKEVLTSHVRELTVTEDINKEIQTVHMSRIVE